MYVCMCVLEIHKKLWRITRHNTMQQHYKRKALLISTTSVFHFTRLFEHCWSPICSRASTINHSIPAWLIALWQLIRGKYGLRDMWGVHVVRSSETSRFPNTFARRRPRYSRSFSCAFLWHHSVFSVSIIGGGGGTDRSCVAMFA